MSRGKEQLRDSKCQLIGDHKALRNKSIFNFRSWHKSNIWLVWSSISVGSIESEGCEGGKKKKVQIQFPWEFRQKSSEKDISRAQKWLLMPEVRTSLLWMQFWRFELEAEEALKTDFLIAWVIFSISFFKERCQRIAKRRQGAMRQVLSRDSHQFWGNRRRRKKRVAIHMPAMPSQRSCCRWNLHRPMTIEQRTIPENDLQNQKKAFTHFAVTMCTNGPKTKVEAKQLSK